MGQMTSLKLLVLVSACTYATAQISLSTFRDEALRAHNIYRATHGATALQPSSELIVEAQRQAEQLAAAGNLQFGNGLYGENLAWTTGDFTGQSVTDFWYRQNAKYDYDAAQFSSDTASFTQLVWSSSQRFGIGKASNGGRTYVVAKYDPKGNIVGQFAENVFRPNSQVTTPSTSTTIRVQNDLDTFRRDLLRAHNTYRARHGAALLQLNITLNNVAQRHAESLALAGQLRSSNGPYGENLGWTSGVATGQSITDLWYQGSSKYNYDAGQFSSETGTFTQLVWNSSRNIGVGKASSGGRTYIVTNYDPRGNMAGEFEENVFRPIN